MDHCSLDDTAGELPCSPAAERNAEPILAELRRLLPAQGTVVEIASGTGQHVVHFAGALPGLQWQPSDSDALALETVEARRRASGLGNIDPVRRLDVGAADWPVARADAIVCCNLLHIAPWAVTPALMAGAGRILAPGAPLVLYGPFRRGGAHTAGSNARFDADLRSRDARWGIRDLEAVDACAAEHGLEHAETLELPANNLLVTWRRGDQGRVQARR